MGYKIGKFQLTFLNVCLGNPVRSVIQNSRENFSKATATAEWGSLYQRRLFTLLNGMLDPSAHWFRQWFIHDYMAPFIVTKVQYILPLHAMYDKVVHILNGYADCC